MTDHYDVIIVGSGAGGGTLAHRLAPSGKRVLILERGDWLPARDRELGRHGGLRRQPLRLARHLVRRRRATAFQPQVHYFVGGATKFYGAALYRLRERDFGELKHHGGISPAWPIDYERARALLHAGRGAVPGARRPRRGPDRAAGVGAVPLPAGLARAAHPAALRRPDPGRAAPLPLALAASCSTRRSPALQRVHPLRDLRRLPLPGARQVRRRRDRRTAGAGARQRPPGPQRRRTPARDRRSRVARSPRSSPTWTARSSASPATSSWSRPARRTRPSCCSPAPTTATPHGLANGSDQVGRNYVFHNSRAFLAVSTEPNDTRFQKTLGPQRLLLRRRRLRLPDGQPADGRQVVGPDVPRREAARDQAGADASR